MAKLIFVSVPTYMHFSLFPAAETGLDTVDLSQTSLFLYPVQIIFGGSLYDAAGTNDILQPSSTLTYQSSNRILRYSTNTPIPKGYYILSSHYSLTGPIAQITFSTFNYICPYNLQFPDVNLNFQGCSAPSNNQPGYPCISYDYFNMKCLVCAGTHKLVNGSCLASTTCPERHYFHFGTCYPVSSACGDFDHFTGACLSCKDPLNMRLIEGNCTFIDIQCG